jgi:hypothetical protein
MYRAWAVDERMGVCGPLGPQFSDLQICRGESVSGDTKAWRASFSYVKAFSKLREAIANRRVGNADTQQCD